MESSGSRFSITREGKGTVKIRASDLNISTLSNFFSLVPSTITLVSGDDEMETHGEMGCFPSWRMDRRTPWRCQGTPQYPSCSSKRKAPTSVSLVGERPEKRRRRPIAIDVEVCSVEHGRKGKKRTITPVSTLRIDIEERKHCQRHGYRTNYFRRGLRWTAHYAV